MHVRHEKLFRWMQQVVPGSKLYGPYTHQARTYFQWMARGKALREILLPILVRNLPILDDHVRKRIEDMISRYGLSTPPADS
jgi:hypothetical protein